MLFPCTSYKKYPRYEGIQTFRRRASNELNKSVLVRDFRRQINRLVTLRVRNGSSPHHVTNQTTVYIPDLLYDQYQNQVETLLDHSTDMTSTFRHN